MQTFFVTLNKVELSAIGDHVTSTDHNLKWDHFDLLRLMADFNLFSS